MSEAAEQIKVFEWAYWVKNKYPGIETMYHIANEGKRSASNGAYMKRQGLKSGVSDICVPVARCGYNNLYIELKTRNNKATKEQLKFIELINRYGGKALVVYEADNAIEVIKAYFEGRIDELKVINNEYPYKQRRTRSKRGFCGQVCGKCKNLECIERR